MNKNTFIVLGLLSIGGAIAVYSFEAEAQVSDKVIVIKGATASVYEFCASKKDEAVFVRVCGTALSADGGVGEAGCHEAEIQNGAVRDNLLQLMAGPAKRIWRVSKGFEN